MNKGLNNIDIVYYINLEHRTDRFQHITNELNKTNFDKNKINRIEGIYIPDFGILGCAKSHIKALETFLNTPDNITNCVIFEDDFKFTKPQTLVNDLLNKFFNNIKDFDVLMLASNTYYELKTYYDFVTKIIDAQTLSGYVVSKKFAPILLNNYKESVELLETIGYKVTLFCFDYYMKQLQPKSNWLCLNPKIGEQIESYSDIEKKNVYYGV